MSERTYRVAMMFAGDPRSRATLKLEETRLGGIARALRTVSLDVEAAVYADEVADGVREQLLRGEPRRVRELAFGLDSEDGYEGSALSDSPHELGHRHASLYDIGAIPLRAAAVPRRRQGARAEAIPRQRRPVASAPRGWLLGRCLVRQIPSGTSPCSSPKLLDGAALSVDCRAHRAAGAASDMVEWPASAARRATRAAVSQRRGIPERERPRRIAG